MLNFDLEHLENILDIKDSKDKNLLEKAYSLNCKCESIHGYKLYSNISNETALLLSIDFKADLNTIIASLIYHAVYFFNICNDDIKKLFNDDIATKVNYLIKFDSNLLNCHSNNQLLMMNSIIEDVKVTIIKLVERVSIFHNIHNLSKDFIDDTLNFYVPIAKLLGIYKIKNNLEDLCFRYDNNYETTCLIKQKVEKEYNRIINHIIKKMSNSELAFSNDLTLRFNQRSNYEIYRKALEMDKKVKELNNKQAIKLSGFCSIQCLTKERQQCYLVLYLFHQFHHLMGSFNDFIGWSQGNEYKAIHTNIFIASSLVDVRICTDKMHRVNLYGVTSNWKEDMNLQRRLETNYSFYDQLKYLQQNDKDLSLINKFILEHFDNQNGKNESSINDKTKKLKLN